MLKTSGHQRVHGSAKTVPSRDMARIEDPGGVMAIGVAEVQFVPVTVAVPTT
jgi:hypothetical protein